MLAYDPEIFEVHLPHPSAAVLVVQKHFSFGLAVVFTARTTAHHAAGRCVASAAHTMGGDKRAGIGTCKGMCVGTCIDTCVGMCVGMCMRMFKGICV